MAALSAALLGALVGLVTGLVPGLHVNLLAALALAIPGLPEDAAWALVAVGTVHTFVSILPTTYLGAPEPETALSVLPAHRLLRDGAGPEAVQISLHASMVAALAAVLLLWPLHRVLMVPESLPFLQRAAPVILILVPLWMAWRDARPLAALGVGSLAALLGHLAFDWPVHGILAGAATPLLPLLSGLFGVPTLLWALGTREPLPEQDAPPPDAGAPGAALAGVGAASFTAILPGLTAAVATAIAMPRRASPRRVLATLSAVNTAHLIIALAMLWMVGRTRSGLAIAWEALRPTQGWVGLPPPDVLGLGAVVLASGALAVLATTWLDGPYRRALASLPPRLPELLALATIVALVALTTGWTGMLLLVAAVFAGLVPLAAGTRRVHLAAALSVPIAFRLATG